MVRSHFGKPQDNVRQSPLLKSWTMRNDHFPENALLIRSTLTLACVRILVRLFMLGVQTSAQNTYTCVCPPPPHS